MDVAGVPQTLLPASDTVNVPLRFDVVSNPPTCSVSHCPHVTFVETIEFNPFAAQAESSLQASPAPVGQPLPP